MPFYTENDQARNEHIIGNHSKKERGALSFLQGHNRAGVCGADVLCRAAFVADGDVRSVRRRRAGGSMIRFALCVWH
eukprot:COSAG06_NODE_14002_length_1198_cov_1.442220_3_plen_77_part_00